MYMGLHKEELKLEIENIKANLCLFLEAEEYYNNHRYKKAAELYRLGALPKDGETMYNWGVILGDEIDGVKYITQSIQLLKKAADLGYVSAYGALALAYLTKDDLKKDDYEQAFYYAKISRFRIGLVYFA